MIQPKTDQAPIICDQCDKPATKAQFTRVVLFEAHIIEHEVQYWDDEQIDADEAHNFVFTCKLHS